MVKTGFEMFDALHAYGLAILLATASGCNVDLRDEGLVYALLCQTSAVPAVGLEILGQLFALPETGTLLAKARGFSRETLSEAVLDGLLAALFTQGHRITSVSDALDRQAVSPSSVSDAHAKVSAAIERWGKAMKAEERRAGGWVAEILRDYDDAHPSLPLPTNVNGGPTITVPMTIDPALGYSARRPRSDGHVERKTNVTFRGTRYAPLLSFVGASRFLRAQRVSGRLVNLYVPLAVTLTLDRQTALPTLFSVACPPDQATAWYWLGLSGEKRPPGAIWRGLSYQTMQTQGAQQSITLDWGYLDSSWLARIEEEVGQGVIKFWRSRLDARGEVGTSDERERLLDFLKKRRLDSWAAHLSDGAACGASPNGKEGWTYSLEEVRKITAMTQDPSKHPLQQVLEREEGTLRFGRALRLLGQQNPAILRDLLEQLETVQTLEQLILALHRAVQECELGLARTKFMIVPGEDDFSALLQDVHQHGACLIARTIMLLSSLRYPRAREVDKYSVYTLIRLLLLLSEHLRGADHAEEALPTALLPGAEAAEAFERITFEGEPEL